MSRPSSQHPALMVPVFRRKKPRPARLTLHAQARDCHPLFSLQHRDDPSVLAERIFNGGASFLEEVIHLSQDSIRHIVHQKGNIRIFYEDTARAMEPGHFAILDDGIGFDLAELQRLLAVVEQLLKADGITGGFGGMAREADRITTHALGLLKVFLVADRFTLVSSRAGVENARACKVEYGRDGFCHVSEVDHPYLHGTLLSFQLIPEKRLPAAAIHHHLDTFFGHSKIPLLFKAGNSKAVRVGRLPFPWDVARPSRWMDAVTGPLRQQWLEFADGLLQEPSILCFPVYSRKWGLQGMGCIRQKRLGPCDAEQHAVFWRRGLIGGAIRGIAPAIVRCVVELEGVPLNTQMDGFVETAGYPQEIFRAVYIALERAVEQVEVDDPELFVRIASLHADCFREMGGDAPGTVFSRLSEASALSGGNPGPPPDQLEAAVSEIYQAIDSDDPEGRLRAMDPQIRIGLIQKHPSHGAPVSRGVLGEADLLTRIHEADGGRQVDFLLTLEQEEDRACTLTGPLNEGLEAAFLSRTAADLLALARGERDGHRRWLLFLAAQCAAQKEGAPALREEILAHSVIYNFSGAHTARLVRLFWPLFLENRERGIGFRANRRFSNTLLLAAGRAIHFGSEFPQIPREDLERAMALWRRGMADLGVAGWKAIARMEVLQALRLRDLPTARDKMLTLNYLEPDEHLVPARCPHPDAASGVPGGGQMQAFGCSALVRQVRILFYCAEGNALAAWRCARHDLEGWERCPLPFCFLAPWEALATLPKVLAGAGMHSEARNAHRRGLAGVIDRTPAVGWLGDHLRYMVQTGALSDAGKLLDQTLHGIGIGREQPSPVRPPGVSPLQWFHFLRGASTVVSAEEPASGGGWLRSEAERWALRFDLRNSGRPFLRSLEL